MANLTNSTTKVQKATYVPLKIARERINGRVALKFGYIRQLRLQPGEVDAVRRTLPEVTTAPPGQGLADANLWSLLQQFEGTPLVSQLPSASGFANIAEAGLISFGNGLTTVRKQAVQRLQQTPAPATPGAPSQPPPATQPLAVATNLLNTSSIATNAFSSSTSTSNMGWLRLERLEMTPAGVERGALLATIPLAPKERTAVVQQEWSVTSKEFTSIVTDSLENYSQTGVTENTQLAQATTSQAAHSNQFNITGSVSGGIGFVSGSVGTSWGSQDQFSQSENDSRQHAIQTTRQASSRVKQSHKVTISTSTVTGASQTSTRTFENPSATDPMRVDYFSLMRKWYVALYSYGLRLTYDITVPEPGAALRKIYADIDALEKQIGTFVFNLPHSAIDQNTYPGLADQYGAQVPPYPFTPDVIVDLVPSNTPQGQVFLYSMPALKIPDGFWIVDLKYKCHVEAWPGSTNVNFSVLGTTTAIGTNSTFITSSGQLLDDDKSGNVYLFHKSGSLTPEIDLFNAVNNWIEITASVEPTDAAVAQWQSDVWNALYNAAQTAFYANQQTVNAQIQALQAKLNNVDTLTLRREENDEIMKCMLRWILGPNFEFMPSLLIDELFAANPAGIFDGVNFTGNDLPSGVDWTLMSSDQARVNFINQALDWSSVVYFLYSYFWDIPTSWNFIRQIQHPDSTPSGLSTRRKRSGRPHRSQGLGIGLDMVR